MDFPPFAGDCGIPEAQDHHSMAMVHSAVLSRSHAQYLLARGCERLRAVISTGKAGSHGHSVPHWQQFLPQNAPSGWRQAFVAGSISMAAGGVSFPALDFEKCDSPLAPST